MNLHTPNPDPFNLARFLEAQEEAYPQARAELENGRKESHWMWFVFPQIEGLGHSPAARYYAIKSEAEAAAYLAHPVLGERLAECAGALLRIHGKSAAEILDFPDDLKLRSSMTLFAGIAGRGSVFQQILERYFGGEPDPKTVAILAQKKAADDRA